ncbi:hypothetical protein ABHA01_16355 [Clostridium paraputrificum]|uniref:hypothetical protein n=1 Tax=Clostridium paraputrificum TaxID=29363 RepID=UPI00325B18F9
MDKNNSSINSVKNKLSSIEASLTEAHSKTNAQGKEKIEDVMKCVVKASEELSDL